MPGNELGDRVHNFFEQDNTSQGQHHSQIVEGNWPGLSNNLWVGSQRQIDLLTLNNRNCASPNSDHTTHGLNYGQSNLRPDFPKSQSHNQQLNLNGFMYDNQFHQTRQNETNFLAMGTDPNQHHLMTSRDLSVHDLHQGSGPNHQTKATVRSESSVPPISFDLFGGQQQMNHQQSSMLQSLQQPQSGLGDMQQLQQQLLIRKMQELQRQQQYHQLELRQQNSINQAAAIGKQGLSSGSLQYPWTAEIGTSWVNRFSPVMQGSANGHFFPSNMGQTQRSVDGVPQQVDQSLYGVPVSGSGGLPVNNYFHMMADKSSLPQIQLASNAPQGNQLNVLPDEVGLQDASRRMFHHDSMSGHASGQAVNTGIRNMGSFQQLNSMPRSAPQQDLLGRQELVVRHENSHEKPARQVASSQNEVALDPTEAKILFGSDDNIWAAFGKSSHGSGEASNLFDQGGLSNGLPSIHSGSWSALMQSAVAESSSSDMAPQEELSGLIFNSNAGPSANQPLSMHNDNGKQEPSLASYNVQTPSAMGSGSVSRDINVANVMELNPFGHKFQNESDQREQTEMSKKFVHSLEEASKWSNCGPSKSAPQGGQLHRPTSNHLEAERNTRTIPKPWAQGLTETAQPNGWNAMLPGGDRGLNHHKMEMLSQNAQSDKFNGTQGEVIRGSSSWKSNAFPCLAPESGHIGVAAGITQSNKGIMTLTDAASVAISSDAGIGDGTSPFVKNNGLLNQWKNVNAVAKFHGTESLGKMMHQVTEPGRVLDSFGGRDKGPVAEHEMGNCDMKENSNSSHHSNLSQHTSSGFRESGFSDVSDSQSLFTGKQKSNNQLSRKTSVPRKFQYHPMGNLDEDVETNYVRKQPAHMQAMSMQTAHLGQSQSFAKVSSNSAMMEKGQSELLRENKNLEETFHGVLPDHELNNTVAVDRSFDTYNTNKASSSQNMLELLHKVDQSRDHGAMMQFSSSECRASSQISERENFDGVGRLYRSNSSVSQGFGLQLGPPSQRSQMPDCPSSSQNAQGTSSSHVAALMGEKGQQMGPTAVQSLLSAHEETEVELGSNQSATPKNFDSEKSFYKIPGSFPSAFSSGIPYPRSHLQDQQITRVTGQMPKNKQIDSSGNTYLAQRGSMDSHLPDISASIRHDKPSSGNDLSDGQVQAPSATISSRDHNNKTSQHGDSTQTLHNRWTNIPQHPHNLGAQFPKVASHVAGSLQPNILESNATTVTSGYIYSKGGVDVQAQRSMERSDHPAESVNKDADLKLRESQGKISSINNQFDASPANYASTKKDIEAFGRSLKPNSFSHQNYSMVNQMQASRNAESDPSSRFSKKMKKPDNILDIHHQMDLKDVKQNENSAAVGDSRGSNSAPASEDSRMLSFSRPADLLHKNASQPGNIPSQDMSGLASDVSMSNTSSDYTTVKVHHPQVSPQMAPSWFNQYGTFRNGQTLTMYDGRNVTPLRHGESPYTLGKPSTGLDALHSEEKSTALPIDVSNSLPNIGPSSVVNGNLSAQSSQSNASAHHPAMSRPKKRKTATSELCPWHKEMAGFSQNCWTISVAESDWSKASNRLTEKVEDDGELIDDGPPVLRSKRRLILTTQLMQQLLRPAPAAVLSVDASSDYECIAYTVSRLVLGDACSAVSCPTDVDVPHDGMDLTSTKGTLSKRSTNLRLVKLVEEFMGRARKLESDFLRLDKSASTLDLRVECQDVEKFAVINRFARFHGRSQNDSGETATTDVTAAMQKPTPQRYVTALPVPRCLPDRVQCLSL